MHGSEFLNRLEFVESSKFPKPHLLWKFSITTGGGGCLTFEGKKKRATHVMWFLTYGNWPKQQLNHICDLPNCVEPSHLYDGSQSQNQKDRRKNTHFKCGHPKVEANIHKNGASSIRCRECNSGRLR